MKQTTLSVVLEVQPQSADNLSALIGELRHREDKPPPGSSEQYGRLKNGVPVLHFMSLSVFPSADYDPIFVIEANFDGPAGVFWGQLEATLGIELRAMLRCCKKPADQDGPLYLAVTSPDSRVPLAPYLEARTLRPSVFHHGTRGMDRDRILREGELFLATRRVLTQSSPTLANPYRAMTAEQIHANLRAALQPDFPWLDIPAPIRISRIERAGDLARLIIFLFLLLACLSIPGAVIAFISPWQRFLVIFAVLGCVVAFALYLMRLTASSLSRRNKLTSLAHPATLAIAVMVLLALYIAVASAIGTALAVLFTGLPVETLWCPTIRVVALGLVSVFLFTIPALVFWLRRLERRDASHDAPPIDSDMMLKMGQREDRIAQNHMGSVVLVKPGVLRTLLFRTGHRGLGLVLRVVATDGYLGSMRTIHFAHWAFVNNGSRLMFFSNFDHSWESYLDDFIEKAHGGLTLAWGSCIGFPPTRFLVLDGASHGRKFKAWARHSMAVSRFWFAAYKDYTVDQIERHARIANGLRQIALTKKEADAWVRDL